MIKKDKSPDNMAPEIKLNNGEKIVGPSSEGQISHEDEPVRIVEVRQSETGTVLRIALSNEFYDELFGFLKQKGYSALGRDQEGLSLLLEFGLAEDTQKELENNRNEMWKEGPRYAAISFKTAELYARNFDLTKGLRLHLLQNRSFKKRLLEMGYPDYVTQDEWDSWDENTIKEFYNRYVFGK